MSSGPVVSLMDWPGGSRCCLCFEGFEVKDLEPVSDEEGRYWDVCKQCAAIEKAQGAKY